MAIDIGLEAIHREGVMPGYTIINKENPANESGTIAKVMIYADEACGGVEVAIFEEVSADHFTTRSNVTLGNIPAGYSEHEVSLEVEAGDYIGIYSSDRHAQYDTPGYAGYWEKFGDKIPCTDLAFTFHLDRGFSLYGESVAAGFPHSQGIIIG